MSCGTAKTARRPCVGRLEHEEARHPGHLDVVLLRELEPLAAVEQPKIELAAQRRVARDGAQLGARAARARVRLEDLRAVGPALARVEQQHGKRPRLVLRRLPEVLPVELGEDGHPVVAHPRLERCLVHRAQRRGVEQLRRLARLELGHKRPRRRTKPHGLQHGARLRREETVDVLTGGGDSLEERVRRLLLLGGVGAAEEEEHRPARFAELALRGERRHRRLLHALDQLEDAGLVALAAVLPRLAVLHHEDGGVALHRVPVAERRLGRRVHLADAHALDLACDLIEDRRQPLAVPTPRRIELDEPERVRIGRDGAKVGLGERGDARADRSNGKRRERKHAPHRW